MAIKHIYNECKGFLHANLVLSLIISFKICQSTILLKRYIRDQCTQPIFCSYLMIFPNLRRDFKYYVATMFILKNVWLFIIISRGHSVFGKHIFNT